MKIKSQYGTIGDDTLKGGRGKDMLYGLQGEDILKGGRGNDHLFGGANSDEMKGGKGKDTFVFEANVLDVADQIADFEPGRDSIVVIDYDAGQPGTIFPLTAENVSDFFTFDDGLLLYKDSPLVLLGATPSYLDLSIYS
jgi:Ca2+-binding RTX toxin-like protein